MRPNDMELGIKNMRNVHVTYTYTSAAADADFALAQCAHRFVAECRLEDLSFFGTCLLISGGRRYPNIISLRLGLNYTCGVLRSLN